LTWTHKQKIAVMLGATTLIPMVVLGWLGARILAQERDTERQSAAESLKLEAGKLALGIEGQFAEIEEKLARGIGIPFTPSGIGKSSDFSPLYQPGTISTIQSKPDFSEAEIAEREDRTAAAADAYRRWTGAPDPAVRAIALLRLGGVLRKVGDRAGAVRAYDEIENLGAVAVYGEPAALLAHRARATVFKEDGQLEKLRREITEFAQTLYGGGWLIDRGTFEDNRDRLIAWGAPPPPAESVASTDAAIHLWKQWNAGELKSRGRKVLAGEGNWSLALWVGGPRAATVWMANVEQVQALLRSVPESARLSVSIYDVDGQLLLEGPVTEGVSLMPSETRLPFNLRVAAADGYGMTGGSRRALLLTVLGLAFGVMAVAAFGLYRVTTREMALARQQADFVSAVSHEFRSPLTSMRHLTDLLASQEITSEDRKMRYYKLLARETERLHRMVESLLSFGRIEAGAYAWRLEPHDAAALVHSVVEEFQGEPQAAGREITCEIEGPPPLVRADRESLTRALWNLLENAAKYSPPGTPIRVGGRRQKEKLLLSVSDEGVGVPFAEQERIFQKFVRGADAKRAGVRGVGIGLTLVQRVAEAHGGSVRLESEPGRGSTFTLVLQCLES
jgi:signal transduction histidine kinase